MKPAMDVFDEYGKHYDLLYRDKNYAAETDYIDRLVNRWRAPGKAVLEFGSGTGKHGRLLADRGYAVLGIERSAEMVSRATHGGGFTSIQGDVCEVSVGQSFDIVLALFHVVSYQVSDISTKAVFAKAAEHLRDGGLFIFDVWHGPAVLAERPSVRVKRAELSPIKVVRIAEPRMNEAQRHVTVAYTLFTSEDDGAVWRSTQEEHQMRYFDREDIGAMCRSSGFTLLRTEEWLTGREPSPSTWGVCYVLRKG